MAPRDTRVHPIEDFCDLSAPMNLVLGLPTANLQGVDFHLRLSLVETWMGGEGRHRLAGSAISLRLTCPRGDWIDLLSYPQSAPCGSIAGRV